MAKRRRARRIALGNNKGGSGKSAKAKHLAAALARKGYTVLVGDLDPQGNVSDRLGWQQTEMPPDGLSRQQLDAWPQRKLTISEAIQSGKRGIAAEVVQPIGWDTQWSSRISLLPADFELENRVPEAGVLDSHQRLAEAMEGVDDACDVTLFDLQPSLGPLTQLGLAAADWALGVVTLQRNSVGGVRRYRDFVQTKARSLGNPDLRFLGVVVTQVDLRRNSQDFHLQGLRQAFEEDQIWLPFVPDRVLFKDAEDSSAPFEAFTGDRRAVELDAIFDNLADRLIKETD